jgi:hypothetical protein
VQVDHQTATLDDLRTRRVQPTRFVAAAVFRWLNVVRRSRAMSSRRRTGALARCCRGVEMFERSPVSVSMRAGRVRVDA